MTLTDLKKITHETCSAARNVDRLVNSIKFAQAAALGDINQIAEAVKLLDIDAIQDWIIAVFTKQIGEYSIRQMRQLGTELGIKYVTTMSKEKLLIEIVQRQHHDRKIETDVSSVSPVI